MMKIAFCFISKAFFVLKLNLKLDVAIWSTNNYNTQISKDSQRMKFGQLIECNKRNIFLEKSSRKQGRETSSGPVFETKTSSPQLSFNTFRQPSIWHKIKASCLKLQTIDSEICSILISQKRLWDWFLHHILCLIFPGKCFLCYILQTDQISLSDCLYFLRYCTICVFQLFVSQVATS